MVLFGPYKINISKYKLWYLESVDYQRKQKLILVGQLGDVFFRGRFH